MKRTTTHAGAARAGRKENTPKPAAWHRRGRKAVRRAVFRTASSVALGGLCGWAAEEGGIRVVHRPLPLRGLGEELEGKKIVHVSDLHHSPIVLGRYLRRAVAVINKLRPDLVVITGDFITGLRLYATRVANILKDLRPKVATLACLGNHDYGLWHPTGLGAVRGLAEHLVECLQDAGVRVLLNEAWTWRQGRAKLQVVGLEDHWTGRYDAGAAFDRADHAQPIIALCHNPDAAAELARRGAQWILAGHTHGCTGLARKLHELVLPVNHKHLIAGHYPLEQDRHVYVNSGLGHAIRIPPNRKPEITLFALRPA
jgi:hypothetical protein